MQLPDIKTRLQISTVLTHYGLEPNRNNMLNCPFHEDSNASMKIYPDTNTFNCFGCGKNGDTIEFCSQKEGSKHKGILKATELCNGLQPINGKSKQPKLKHLSDKTNEKAENHTETLTKFFKYFQNSLNHGVSVKPKEYLQSRNLNYELLEVGYNSGQFHHRGKLNEVDKQKCIAAGLLIPYKGRVPNSKGVNYTAFAKDCIIFPLKNKQGQIVSIYGRSIIDNKNAKHYYTANRQGLYPGYPKPETTRLILTEAIIDTATLLQIPEIAKEYSILSCYGTNGFTTEHKEAIKELNHLKEVIIFFDGDKSGKAAVRSISKELLIIHSSLLIRMVETPKDEDVNSLLDSHEPEILTHLIENCKSLTGAGELSGGVPALSAETLVPAEGPTSTSSVSSSVVENKTAKLTTSNPEQPSAASSRTPIKVLNEGEQLIYETPDLKITIWGGIEKENLSRLKVSMHIKSKVNKYKSFRDDVNLYSHGNTQKLIQNISETLEVSTTTITKTITDLTEELEAYRLQEREATAKALKPKLYQMTPEEKEQALKFLKGKGLGRHTLELIQQSGLIGEIRNGLLLYFLYTSRLMEEPLHAIIFGKSGSGKTYLQTKVSECLPEESVRTITSLTENTLYYSAKDFWKHKVLLIEDLEGVYNAFLPLREFMSKQSITKLTTDKDAKGNNIQKLLTVEGPICVSGATTQGSIYEDNANRSFLLHIDESSNHLNQVMEYQRKLQAGQVNEAQQQAAKQLLKNAQRLLRKVKVINPYAPDLRIPDCVFKKLRTNMHYLKLIEIITFYNQYQRKWKIGAKGGNPDRIVGNQSDEYYIETTLEDVELANWLVKETLLRKSDELSGDVRYFFETLKELAEQKPKEAQSFYAKEIRQHFRMNPMKVNRYLHQLESRGYINRTGGNRKTGYEYEIQAWEEYELLKSNIDILDDIIQKIRVKCNGKATTKTEAKLSVTQV